MALLNTTPNLERPDDLYARLVDLGDGPDDRRNLIVLAKLILLLANHIGDEAILTEAIKLAGVPNPS